MEMNWSKLVHRNLKKYPMYPFLRIEYAFMNETLHDVADILLEKSQRKDKAGQHVFAANAQNKDQRPEA